MLANISLHHVSFSAEHCVLSVLWSFPSAVFYECDASNTKERSCHQYREAGLAVRDDA